MYWLKHPTIMTVIALACLLPRSLRAQEPTEEQRLVKVLLSSKPAKDKGAACARLKRIGTARSVPALAELLAIPELSHSARYALESMPCPQAGAAMVEGLTKTTGLIQVGLIDSLGIRRESGAVGPLVKLLAARDAAVASAAAVALGRIGGADALRGLRAARPKAPAAVKPALADAMLRCAGRMLDRGDAKEARAVYQKLSQGDVSPHVRGAAFGGLVRSAGKGGADLVVKALRGADSATRLAAIPFVRELKGTQATKVFAALLPNMPPSGQIALIEALAQRDDAAAAPAVTSAAGSSSVSVRLSALNALATLGDGATVPILAKIAASSQGAEQRAARAALARLRRGKVREAILAHLPKSPPAVQAELVGALALRQDTPAVGVLLKMARAGDQSARVAAVKAISMLGGDPVVKELVALLAGTKTPLTRTAIEKALVAICHRSENPGAHATTVLSAMANAPVPARCSLLRVAGRLGGPAVLKTLRAAVKDTDPAIRDAAIRTMAESGGPEMASDLAELARKAPEPTHRALALRGYWRMVGLAGDRPAAQRLKMCQAGLTACQSPRDKWLALAELSRVPHLDALKLAETLCKDRSIQGEAESACVQIAVSLSSGHPDEARTVLQRMRTAAKSKEVRNLAAKALDTMDQYVGYITAWQVAGPYRQKGKECRRLFDIPFAPEQPGKKVAWKPAPRPADVSLFWQADLASIVGGNHCVAYLRSRVYCPEAKRVRLEMGADDGIKLWINGKIAHSNNAVRGLTPGQDKAQADLRKGWNDFLLKITQHTQGCGACVRIRNTDGTVIDGLRAKVAASDG